MNADLGAERLVCRPLPLREFLDKFGLPRVKYYGFFLLPVATAAMTSGPMWEMLWPQAPWAVVAVQVALGVLVSGLLLAHDRWTRSRVVLALHERGFRYFDEGERAVQFAELAQIEIGCRWTALERFALGWAAVWDPTLLGKPKPIAQLSLVLRFRSGKRRILRGFLGRFAARDVTAFVGRLLVVDPTLVTVRDVDAELIAVGNPNPSLAGMPPMR